MLLYPDTCTILRRYPKQKLSYASGSSAFTAGATVTGASSGATAIIDKAPVGTVTAGYLIVRTVTGTFQSGETLTDNHSPAGHATLSGAPATYLNGSNEKEYYWQDNQIGVSARFYQMASRMQVLQAGEYPAMDVFVHLPGNATVQEEEYRISTTCEGVAGLYQILGPIRSPRNMWGVDHYECKLKEVAGS
jgi:hypothetical protein